MAEKKSLEKYLVKIFFDKYKIQFFNFQFAIISTKIVDIIVSEI